MCERYFPHYANPMAHLYYFRNHACIAAPLDVVQVNQIKFDFFFHSEMVPDAPEISVEGDILQWTRPDDNGSPITQYRIIAEYVYVTGPVTLR